MAQEITFNRQRIEVSPDYPTGDYAYYVAGLVDGEGSFWRENGTKKFRFAVKMKDEHDLMEDLQDFFNCGKVYAREDKRTGSTMVRYRVADTRDLARTIIPFFNEYQIHGTTGDQFEQWEKEFWEVWEA
jgi:hypothetical protein